MSEYFHFFLGLIPESERKDAINELNSSGCAPLHCAVMGSFELNQVAEQHEFVKTLLNCGARKNNIDPRTG